MTSPTYEDPGALRPLDLAQPKDVGALITSAWRVWTARPAVFLLIALIVAFVPLVVFGVLAVYFDHAGNAGAMLAAKVAQSAFGGLVGTWIISATHARAVVALASGEDISGGEAVRQGLRVLPRVAWVTVLAGLAMLGGLLLLVIGVFWVMILVLFAVPIAAVTDERGWGAVRASGRLVRQVGWWRTLGNSLVISLVGYAVALAPAIVLGILAGVLTVVFSGGEAALDYVVEVVSAGVETLVLSWTALASTLLYFSHRARTPEPWDLPPGGAPAIDLVRSGPEPVGGVPTFARAGHTPPSAPPPSNWPPAG